MGYSHKSRKDIKMKKIKLVIEIESKKGLKTMGNVLAILNGFNFAIKNYIRKYKSITIKSKLEKED